LKLPGRLAALHPGVFFADNGLTLFGAVLTTSAAFTLIAFWLVELALGARQHPYAGIVLFLLLPAFFVLGLVLMPLGVWIRRRQRREQGTLAEEQPRLDLASPLVRRGLRLFLALTAVNVVLLGLASYRGVEYMDSTQFCGAACHSVMAPEYTAYARSPHSSVACVECHIGPGASSFVRAKISGVRQLFGVTFDTHSRPIPTPVKQLRPARETCGHCHGAQKSHAEAFVVRTHYAGNERNARSTTVLAMKLNGQGSTGAAGIHGHHLDDAIRISYVSTDGRRQVIPKVTYKDASGKTLDYLSTDAPATPDELARGEERVMDCLDCHNRPSHTFEMPERALDRAFTAGGLSRELPFLKKTALALLKKAYPDRDTAAREITAGLTEFYRASQPAAYASERASVDAAARTLVTIYESNVFPSMKVTWGTYPNNLGHDDFPGCFRCHDDKHKAANGKTISQDCEICHSLLAQDESDPKALAALGVSLSAEP
jgi:hypothetical protein